MKTTKRLLLSVFATLMTIACSAQLYINVGAGYGFAANRELLLFETNADSAGGSEKGVYGSLGSGIMPHLAIGYQANDHVAVELGYDYLLGKKYTGKYHENNTPSGAFDSNSELFARSNRVLLNLRFGIGEDQMIWYMRTGLVLGLGNKITYTYNSTDVNPGGTTTVNRIEEYTGGLAIGYTGACGFTYMFGDMMGLYVEGFFISQEWAPKHSEYTKYDVNGQDQLGNLTTNQIETDYVDEVSNVNGSPNTSAPDQSLKWYYPMSSVGIAVGLHIHLGGQ